MAIHLSLFRRSVTALALTAAAAAAAAVLAAGGRSVADTPLLASYAEVEITPPLGGSMPGYFRDRQAEGTLDPLKAKVLYLSRGGERIAVVACDLIGVGAPLVERIRSAVAAAARARGVPAPRHVWVHATHTHTGGMVPRGTAFTRDAERIYPGFYPGRVDEAWVDDLVRKTADAIARAADTLAPEGSLTLHEGQESTIAHYRRFLMKDGSVRTNPGRGNPDAVRPVGTIDPRVHTLRFENRRILVVIYGLHPDCVGGARYSADYPHHLTESLRESPGPDWKVLFLNACCGNINHVDVANREQKSGPEESRRIGRRLADAVRASLLSGSPLQVDRLAARETTLRCRLRKPKPEDVAEAEERLRENRSPFEFNGLFAPAAIVLARTRDREHEARIAVLRLGWLGLAAVPGEYFVELGREIEAGSPLRVTRTIGLTNGSMGYIPTRQAYREGGYEAGYRSARYEPENGHRWAAAAVRLLRETGK